MSKATGLKWAALKVQPSRILVIFYKGRFCVDFRKKDTDEIGR